MGIPTETAIDYSEDYALIAARLEEINQTLTAILARMQGNNLGVYMRPVDDEAKLSRALTVNALEQSGQIDAVRGEMNNPTPLP